jgi:hypothetical protein
MLELYVSLDLSFAERPLANLGNIGLLWALNGGRLVELHREWALIERAENRSGRVFERRCVDAANVALPWMGP